jgi:hypothetical protein
MAATPKKFRKEERMWWGIKEIWQAALNILGAVSF